MLVIEEDNMQLCYKKLIETLKNETKIINGTKEIENCCLTVLHPEINKIHFPYRTPSINYANRELEWYWSADNSCETIGKYAKMWLSISDDGKTNNSAYGYILFKKYGFNQLEQIIELLKKDPSSRRAVLNISDPSINRITTKDMQCTIAIQFLIREGKLNETVYMRSNDVFFGLPYDYVFFISLMKYISERLDLEIGKYTHVVTSIHMYERDFEKFEKDNNEYLEIDFEKIIKENYKYEK